MAQSYFRRKVKDIRFKYGDSAVAYFVAHAKCEDCGEPRLVVLNVHHTQGKKVEEFKTLCFNCHMLEHNKGVALDTYRAHLDNELAKKSDVCAKFTEILRLLELGVSIREIIKMAKTSIETIHKVMGQNGFISAPRVGYEKQQPV